MDKKVASGLNLSILQYLKQSELKRTTKMFKEEVKSVKPKQQEAPTIKDDILKAFEQGKKEPFQKLWDDLNKMASSPDNILKNKIDFYSCVYFTIFPIHSISGKPPN